MAKKKTNLLGEVKQFKKIFRNKLKSLKKKYFPKRKKKGKKNEINLPLLTVAFIFTSLSSFHINSRFSKKIIEPSQTLGEKTENTFEKQKKFWLNYLKQNPHYIDGWLELTKIEYELGNVTRAIQYLEKAKNINPNLSKVKETEMKLGL
jgi:tetratricopeptide (TPR) repeat protein